MSDPEKTGYDEAIDDNRRHWYVGKEIPVATIFVLILQTAGVVWWAASTSSKVDFMKESAIATLQVQASIDRRQDDETMRSEGRIGTQLEKLNQKLDRIIERPVK